MGINNKNSIDDALLAYCGIEEGEKKETIFEATSESEKGLWVVADRIVKALAIGSKERAHQITQDAKEAGMDMNKLAETCKILKSK
ncbi:hypothetical protein KAR91_40130 [Candidatus Pacearchaeota archaeon]|nr:hypothetical protein [Candidatus Pacearchaeota archaeon]